MSDFSKSQEAAYRRLIRQTIRKAGFSKVQRDVVLALVNHWFHYRTKGKMHPSRELIARKAEVSEKTVQRVFALLRENGVLVQKSPLKMGRGKAVEYVIDDLALVDFCGAELREIIAAMTPQKRDKCPTNDGAKRGTGSPTVYNNTLAPNFPSQENENPSVVFFPAKGVANG